MANVCIVRHLNNLAQGWRETANKNGLVWAGTLNMIPWSLKDKEKVPHEGRTVTFNGQDSHIMLCNHCGALFMEGVDG